MKKWLWIFVGILVLSNSCKSDYKKLNTILDKSIIYDLTAEVDDNNLYMATRLCDCDEQVSSYFEEQEYKNAKNKDSIQNIVNKKHIPIIHGEGFIIDLREKYKENKHHLITLDDILEWEEKYEVLISNNAIILFYTGFGEIEQDEEAYICFHSNAANFLIKNRNVKVIGTDAPQIDSHYWKEAPNKKIFCDASVPIIERVSFKNLPPALGNQIVLLPMDMPFAIGKGVKLISIVP